MIIHRHSKTWGKFITINLWVVYIYYSKTDRSGWARLFSKYYGLHWKHKDTKLIFSERMGYTKTYTIGNWRFKLLRP